MASSPEKIAYGTWHGWVFHVEGDTVIAESGTKRIERPLLVKGTWQQSAFVTVERLKEDIAEFERTGSVRKKSSSEIFVRSIAHGLAGALIALICVLAASSVLRSSLPTLIVILMLAIGFVVGGLSGAEREKSSKFVREQR